MKFFHSRKFFDFEDFFFIYFYFYVHVFMLLCVVHRDQKKPSDPLDLELQSIVSSMWTLETKLKFSARTVYTLNCQAITPSLDFKDFSTESIR